MDLISTSGLMESFSFRVQQFNYETGQIEAVDLTGAKATFRAYKPSYDVDVEIPIRDRTFTRSISVEGEMAEKLAFAESDEERARLVKETQQYKDLLRDIAAEAGYSINLSVPIGERTFTRSIWVEGEVAKQIFLAESDEKRRSLIGGTQQFLDQMTEIAVEADVALSTILGAVKERLN